MIRKRIFGLEPGQIAGLLEEREAILHGVREGVVAVDDRGRIVLINDAAVRLLALESKQDLVGTLARDSLDHVLAGLLNAGGTEQSLVLAGERVLLVRRVNQAVSFISHERSGGTLSGVTGRTGIDELEVAALLLMKQARAEELGITITIEPDSTLPVLASRPPAEILRADLVTIIGNLLDNAAEATGTGGRISVSVNERTAANGAGALVISVADSGEGIPPGLREQVFAPGYSSKPTRPGSVSTGRGIGLTLVKRIATRHRGTVEIDDGLPAAGTSRFDGSPHGARITVTLPVDSGDIAPAQLLESSAGGNP